MSNNIRGLNDIRRNNDNLGGYGNTMRNMNFFSGNQTNSKDPRKETFWDMLHLNLCPQLVFCSFSVLFVFVIFGIFCVQLGVDGISRDKTDLEKKFLPINITDNSLTNKLLLQKEPIKEEYQIYRLLTALFLHADFTHLLFNGIMIIIWTSYFEIFLTSKKMFILFLLSGFIGNTFSVIIFAGKSLGSSTGIFGIMGCAIGYLIYNWENLDYQESPRFIWTCQVGFITIMSFLFNSSEANNWSHLGGFLAGIFIGTFMCERHERPGGSPIDLTSHEKMWKGIGMVGSFTMFSVCFGILMFA